MISIQESDHRRIDNQLVHIYHEVYTGWTIDTYIQENPDGSFKVWNMSRGRIMHTKKNLGTYTTEEGARNAAKEWKGSI